ncbi:DnaJ [Dirofilaria immitis]
METVYDIALFAVRSSAIDSNDESLFDYYIPWCSPCLRLLKELRIFHNYVEILFLAYPKITLLQLSNVVWHSDGSRYFTRTEFTGLFDVFLDDTCSILKWYQLAPEYKKLVRNVRMKELVHLGMVDCNHHRYLCINLGIHELF